jgi:hypothetical protein
VSEANVGQPAIECEMSLNRQITTGLITKIDAIGDLYLSITAESHDSEKRYVTSFRVGLTNYALRSGDTLSWSSFYNGVGSHVLWWIRNGRTPKKILLLMVESQVVKSVLSYLFAPTFTRF